MDDAILAESGREFQRFETEQENDPSHNEVLHRGTVKLRVSDDLSALLHVSAVDLTLSVPNFRRHLWSAF